MTANLVVVDSSSLAGLLKDIVVADLTEPLSALFEKEWLSGNFVSVACVTVGDYFADLRSFLDPFFFERVACMVLIHIGTTP